MKATWHALSSRCCPLLLVRFQYRYDVATAQRMPPRELEILGVTAFAFGVRAAERRAQLVADVVKWLPVERVVVRQLYAYANNEIKLLPSFVVGCHVGHVGFRGGEPPCVLVRASVNATSGVVRCRPLREHELPVFVPHPPKEFVRVLQIAAQISA